MKRHALVVRILVLSAVLVAIPMFFGGSLGDAEARSDWRLEWEKTVAAAKREGQVTIYGSNSLINIVNAGVFQKAYPEIKIVTVAPGRGSVAIQRLLTERRAGKYLADLIIGGSTTPILVYRAKALDPIKSDLILPEVVDESKWWEGKHLYNDPDHRHIFQYIGHPQIGTISHNTDLVNPKEFKSFWDFVNDKWKGKIEIRDIRRPGAGSSNMKFFYYNPLLGPKFIKSLFGEMDITLFRDIRQSVDWLARGKFSICFFCYPRVISQARKAGLPVKQFGFMMKEGAGLVSHSGSMGLVNRAPHPNAAKVFINWLLSREGQLTMQKAYVKAGSGASNSLRVDISKDMVPPHERLIEGVKYVEVETPDRISMKPILKVFEEALVEAKKRKEKKDMQ